MFRSSVVVYSSCLFLTFAFATVTQAQVQNTIALAQPRHPVSVLDSNKEQDGLVGAVRRIKTESAKIENDASEGPRELIELTTYGLKGNRIENVSYPASDPVVLYGSGHAGRSAICRTLSSKAFTQFSALRPASELFT